MINVVLQFLGAFFLALFIVGAVLFVSHLFTGSSEDSDYLFDKGEGSDGDEA